MAIQESRRATVPLAPLDDAAGLVSSGPRADVQIERARTIARVEQAVAALPVEFRAVFVLRAAEGLEYEEIAQILSVDLGTVKSRLSRARTALRSAVGEDDIDVNDK